MDKNDQKKPDAQKQRPAKNDAEKSKKRRLIWIAGGVAGVAVLAFGLRALTGAGSLRKKVVAETEHYQVTAAMLACYFKQCEESYLAYAASDSSIAVFDENKSLREQKYNDEQTWFDMIMDNTMKTVKTNLQICEAAYQAGFTMSDEDEETCRQIGEQMEEGRYQKGVTGDDAAKAARMNILAESYQKSVRESINITDDQIQSYFDTHQDDYLNVSTLGYTFTWDPEGIVSGDYAEHDAALAAAETLSKCKTQQEYSEYVFKYLTDRKGVERSEAEQIAGDLTITKTIGNYPDDVQEWIRGGAKRNECALFTHEESCSASVYLLREEPAPDESKTVNIRVLYLTAADYDGIENAVSFANDLKDEVDAAENKSEKFASLAYEYSEDAATYPNGGLVNGYSASQTVYGDEISAWAFDRERQNGDMLISERTTSVMLAFFESANAQTGWQNEVREDLYNQALADFTETCESYEVTVHEKGFNLLK